MAFLKAAEVDMTVLSDFDDSDSYSEVELDLTDSAALLHHEQTPSFPGSSPLDPDTSKTYCTTTSGFKEAGHPVRNGCTFNLRPPSPDESSAAPLLQGSDESQTLKEKQKSELFRCLAVGIVCLLQGTAFPIQSTDALLLNVEGSALQQVVLISIYTSFLVSCLGMPALSKLLSLKWIVCLGCTGSFVYAVVRLRPEPPLVVAGALFAGLTQGALLGAAGTLVTHYGTQFAIFGGHHLGDTVALFNGLLYMWLLGAPLLNGILRLAMVAPGDDVMQSSVNSGNGTTVAPESDPEQCGVHYCWNDHDQSRDSGNNTSVDGADAVESHMMQALLGTLVVCALGAWLLAVLALERKTRNVTASSFHIRKEEGCWQFVKSLQLLDVALQWKEVNFGLLLSLLLYAGIQQMVTYYVVVTAFMACESSAKDSIWLTLCLSLASLLTALPWGALTKFAGRVKLIISALVVQLAVYVILLTWSSPPLGLYYGLMALWGMADAALQVQLAAMLGVLFPDSLECSYAGLRIWQVVGYIVLYAMSIYLCVVVILSVSLMLLLIASTLYISLEIMTRLQERERKSKNVEKQSYVMPEFAAWIPQFNPHSRGSTSSLCTKQGPDAEDLIST